MVGGKTVSTTEENQFVGDPRRFIVLAIYFVLETSNNAQWLSFASVPTEAEEYFNLTTVQLNNLSEIFMLVYCLGGFFTCYAVEGMGLTRALQLGAALNFVGMAVKLMSAAFWPTFLACLFGQLLTAVAQLFLLSIPPQLASQWFQSKERTVATAVGLSAGNIGIACGMLVPPAIVHAGVSSMRVAFCTLFGVLTGLCAVALVLTCLFVPERPVVPPSPTAAVQRGQWPEATTTRKRVTREIFKLFKQPNFRVLLCGVSLNIGFSWVLSAMAAQLALPFGISERLTGSCGCAAILVGTALAISVGLWVDRARAYKAPLIGLLGGGLCGTLGLVLLFRFAVNGSMMQQALFCVFFGCAMAAQCSSIPIALEFAAEISYPVQEIFSSTLILALAQAPAVVAQLAFSALLGTRSPAPPSHAFNLLIVFSIIFAVGTVICFFVRSELRRSEYDATAEGLIDETTNSLPYHSIIS